MSTRARGEFNYYIYRLLIAYQIINLQNPLNIFFIKQIHVLIIDYYIRERPFNLKGSGGYVFFLLSSEFFFRTTQELEYFFFVAQSEFFFQNLTLGYMTKTNIFFSSTKIRIFFSATLGIRIFF